MRVVYVDTSGRDEDGTSGDKSYASDSLHFQRGFDQAVWLWKRVAQRDSVTVISVRYHLRHISHGHPVKTSEYFFYPEQLNRPADRPVLERPTPGG